MTHHRPNGGEADPLVASLGQLRVRGSEDGD